jgi:hypothetical protein
MKSGISIKIMWGLAALFFLLPATNSRGEYCTAYSESCSYEYIFGVELETISNMGTDCNDGYTDFTSLSTLISIGQSYTIMIINGDSYTGDQCGIWIDWNQDEDFLDEGEAIMAEDGPDVFTATISAPPNAVLGDTRLRVRITYLGTVSPCGSAMYGEVEDYTVTIEPKYSGGRGEPNDPYLIETPEDLNSIGLDPCDWDKHFLMIEDIDMVDITGTQFNPIGDYPVHFTGVFDGNNHTIINYSYAGDSPSYALFHIVDGPNAVIKNVIMVDADVNDPGSGLLACLVNDLQEGLVSNCHVINGSVNAENFSGLLVGRSNSQIIDCSATGLCKAHYCAGGLVGNVLENGTISNCHTDVNVIVRNGVAGGLVGVHGGDLIINCHSAGTIVGLNFSGEIGGLVGINNGGVIEQCYSTTEVIGGDDEGIGGLVGTNDNSGVISRCFATGDVLGLIDVGGLVGYNLSSDGIISDSYALGDVNATHLYAGGLVSGNKGTIQRCFSAGLVKAGSQPGGLISHNHKTVVDCFWDKETSDCNISDGGTGLTTAEMQQRSTFTDAGWDFVGETINGANDVWDICEGTNYPKFVWQIPPADLVCPDGVDFIDYSVLANQWLQEKVEQDYNSDGRVNFNDWALLVVDWDGESYAEPASFIEHWCALSTGRADIAPPGGDDFVDWQDLMVLAQHWLENM